MCPYTVMYELSKEQALPIDPRVMRPAVATKITFRPTMSAKDPADEWARRDREDEKEKQR